ncbi:MAG: isoprenoid biosynthesis glyoxalase ElbB [Fluviicoccus sp.]|uniref:isoprenoid biosynthesis glyoxalase ElbB n=1 Tax=Fluviicoccus sp. TaxID=2003552 RepID=UPI002728E969|nr:isoprenoid biosynthesis glyoxalase ElbB [Fluviicoccus sp.]MDO8332165.1 isoprenoid biosynthesis glyoxalase ElbB [Fluviicoccus sp.]
MNPKKVAVILSGCGFKDGAEIYEATLTLLALDEADAEVQCFAPDMPQMHVVNHLTGEEMAESRNVLVEAARLARGNIKPVTAAQVADFDALIIPGGFGAAKNLCDFAVKGSDMSVQPDVLAFAKGMHAAGKPVGFICIAPAMAPKVGGAGTQYTIGNDAGTAAAINAMGGKHVECAVDDCVVDRDRKIVTTPAYMYPARIREARAGIQKLVGAVLGMA